VYRFVTHLNFDVPKIRELIDLDFATSTRFLPQFIRTWVYRYETRPVVHAVAGCEAKLHFGPTRRDAGVLDARIARGRLSQCTSTRRILSLNDDIAASTLLSDWNGDCPYTAHYVERWNALVPLAYNPLENPIVVA
jgi:hypothetical protein